MLAEYRKLVSDAKRYHLDKFSSFKITTDRFNSFLFEVVQNQNESQQLWITTLLRMMHYCHYVHMLEIDTRCISWKGKQNKKELKGGRKGKLSWKN